MPGRSGNPGGRPKSERAYLATFYGEDGRGVYARLEVLRTDPKTPRKLQAEIDFFIIEPPRAAARRSRGGRVARGAAGRPRRAQCHGVRPMSRREAAVALLGRWRNQPCQFVVENFGVEPDAWQRDALEAFASKDPAKQRGSERLG